MKIHGSGNLVEDPTIINGEFTAVNFVIAEDVYNYKTGLQETQYHHCSVYGKKCEGIKLAKKGDQIFINDAEFKTYKKEKEIGDETVIMNYYNLTVHDYTFGAKAKRNQKNVGDEHVEQNQVTVSDDKKSNETAPEKTIVKENKTAKESLDKSVSAKNETHTNAVTLEMFDDDFEVLEDVSQKDTSKNETDKESEAEIKDEFDIDIDIDFDFE